MPVAKMTLGFAALLAGLMGAMPAPHAQSVADFYRGKTIHVLIGYGPGGGYDIYGRLAAEFLGKFIPGNPTLVPENMPGNSSLKVVDNLLNVAPKDGTYLGSVQQALALTVLTDDKLAKMRPDIPKLHYVGRFTSNIDVAVALPQAGIKSFDEAKQHEIIVGTDQAGSMGSAFAKVLNAYAGAKLKLVKGYTGSNEVQLAAERGEVQVNGSYSLPAILVSHNDWVKQGKATILYQNAMKRYVDLPDTPTLLDLVQGDEGKTVARVIAGTAEVGRSIITTPGVPPERLAALRTAFQAMLKDPDFIATSKKRNLMIDPGTGEAMDAINEETMKLPAPMVEKLKLLLRD
jgi:tripartite-type tricarboxylate transporter receptor subunit TctC